ncbi:hypothetical protein [Allorhodopirellula solitaria]|uniref:hypothetical protein n=1 Tax=Allorhodopirellula solitaria TaxID=2527987 RepID=UPI0011B75EB2|nr:hypothetical protein [Allorhodopirellula solitaria]
MEVLQHTRVQDAVIVDVSTGEEFSGYPYDKITDVIDAFVPYQELGIGFTSDPEYSLKVFAAGNSAVVDFKFVGDEIEFSFDGYRYLGGNAKLGKEIIAKIKMPVTD